jgi:hypothetical protein
LHRMDAPVEEAVNIGASSCVCDARRKVWRRRGPNFCRYPQRMQARTANETGGEHAAREGRPQHL